MPPIRPELFDELLKDYQKRTGGAGKPRLYSPSLP